eukprot:NODE_58_length_28395_cov_1.465720.p10 type:complete len:346 gc:universal NODE_58_length_28395_cov_1.465720:11324-12361(+)
MFNIFYFQAQLKTMTPTLSGLKMVQISGLIPNSIYNLFSGFGLLDTNYLINNAKNYNVLREQHSFSFSNSTQIKLGRSAIPLLIEVRNVLGIQSIEHVQVKIEIIHPRRGQLSYSLTSPSGFTSQLAKPRINDKSEQGLPNWTFMTNRHWKEPPNGVWTLSIIDEGTGEIASDILDSKEGFQRSAGYIKEWELILYGECVDKYCEQPQIQTPDAANWLAFGITVAIFILVGFSALFYFKYFKHRNQNKKYAEVVKSISSHNLKILDEEDQIKSSPIEVPKDYPFKKQQSSSALPRSISTDSLNTREKRGYVTDVPISPLSPLSRSASGNIRRDNENLLKQSLKNK